MPTNNNNDDDGGEDFPSSFGSKYAKIVKLMGCGGLGESNVGVWKL